MTPRVFITGLLVLAALSGCQRPERRGPTSVPAAPRYIERVTGGAQPEDRLPLIIAVHGYGDRPEAFASLADGYSGRARWVFPRGFDPMGSGHAWFPIRFRDGRAEALASGLESAGARVAELITKIKSERPTAGRVIVTGFSQGGMISFALAMADKPVVDIAIPMGGWLPESMIPTDRTPKVPIIVFHGVDDRVVPYPATKTVVEQLQSRVEYIEFVPFAGLGHRISPEMREALYDALIAALAER